MSDHNQQSSSAPTNKALQRHRISALCIYGIALAIGVLVFLSSPSRSVTGVYETAAQQWLQGESLYAESAVTGHGFLYLPHAAILHTPYVLINRLVNSTVAGDIVWRLVSWVVFVFAAWQFIGFAAKETESVQWRIAIVVSLLGLSCLRIGQSTILMAALIILSVNAWRERKFNAATALIILAIAVKPLALVPALLLFSVSKPMRLKLLLGAVALAISPFLFQFPNYVLTQYQDCFSMLSTAAELGNNQKWAHLFGLLDVFGHSVGPTWQKVIRLIAAAVVLGVVFLSVAQHGRDRAAVWLITWSFVYLMLFNPRTENSTYCLMGPIYGAFMGRLVAANPYDWRSIVIFIGVVLTAGSYEIGKHFTPVGKQAIWLAPLCCCFMVIFLAIQFWRDTNQPQPAGDVNPLR